MTTQDELRSFAGLFTRAASEMDTLEQNLASTQAALDQALADVVDLHTRLTGALDTVAAREAEIQAKNLVIEGLNAEVARLQAELEACQAPEPPAETTVFGAYASPQSRASFDEFVSKVAPVGVTRLFYGSTSSVGGGSMPVPGVPTIASMHSRSFSESVRPKHLDVAAGAIDGRVTTFATKVKAYLDANPGEVFIMSFVAEPDVAANLDLGSDPSHATVGAEYIPAYLRVRQVFEAVVQVPWAMILTGTTFNTNSSSRNPGQFWHDSFEYVGIDPYNMGWHDGNWKASLEPETAKAATFAAAKGKPLIVPEFGSCPHESDPNRRAEWLAVQADVFRRLGVKYAAYFHSDKSGSEEAHRNFKFYEGSTILDQAGLEAFQQILTA